MKHAIETVLRLLVSVMFLASCATANIGKDFDFAAEKNTGLVVGSVTQDDVPGQDASYATFVLEDSRGGERRTLRSRENTEVFSRALIQAIKKEPEDFSDVVGRLFAVELPEGAYRLVRWTMYDGLGHFYPRKDPRPLEFTVEKGKATYIGNLHMQLRTGKNIIGQTTIADVMPVVSDRSERDLPVFASRFPKLKSDSVEKQIILKGPWTYDSGSLFQLDRAR